MQDGYWCDIGDSQNISQNLSTFSGHITNVIRILESASPDSLVILDELGSGTDPAEGMGIAVAVLDELRLRKCMFLVTTHYPQVKSYARQKENVIGARMAFVRDSLRRYIVWSLGNREKAVLWTSPKGWGLHHIFWIEPITRCMGIVARTLHLNAGLWRLQRAD